MMLFTPRNTRRRPLALALAACLTACAAPRAPQGTDRPPNPDRVTSTDLAAAGERDTVYLRRVGMFEQIAATIQTDTLARIMVGAMAAPAEQEAPYVQALMCQYHRMIWQYGAIAPKLAIRRTEDSLFVVPGTRERWNEAQRRVPPVASFDPKQCSVTGLPHAPDSLNYRPHRTASP